MSELQGGNFADGFWAQAFSKIATIGTRPYQQSLGDVGRFTVAVVVGGTVSSIGGGKFSNGATTAAFGYLFNEMSQARALQIQEYVEKKTGEKFSTEYIRENHWTKDCWACEKYDEIFDSKFSNPDIELDLSKNPSRWGNPTRVTGPSNRINIDQVEGSDLTVRATGKVVGGGPVDVKLSADVDVRAVTESAVGTPVIHQIRERNRAMQIPTE